MAGTLAAATKTAITSSDSLSPYILVDLLSDIPLSADTSEDAEPITITCVDVYQSNLYIGTSAGELLHFVSIPGESEDDAATYVLASRLQPPYNTEQEGHDKGVKQILLLPGADKACVLCNGTLTFYSLPEFTPAYGGRIKQSGCTWVGGLDLDENSEGESDEANEAIIVICLKQRLRLIRIGDEARKIRDIELPGVQAIQRRGDLACVADGSSYSLLDVVNQQKVDLFPVSTHIDEPESPEVEKPLPSLPPPAQEPRARSYSAVSPVRGTHSHSRNKSLGGKPLDNSLLQPDPSNPSSEGIPPIQDIEARSTSPSPRPSPIEEEGLSVPQEPLPGDTLPTATLEPPKTVPKIEPNKATRPLLPHIVSPTDNEFLLTTGTKHEEPGVGLFVNLDGDLVPRGTVEFSSYPLSLVLDGAGIPEGEASIASSIDEGYVLALVQTQTEEGLITAIEVQRWDVDPGETQTPKVLIPLSTADTTRDQAAAHSVGLRTASTIVDLSMPKISRNLRLRRLKLDEQTSSPQYSKDDQRNGEEDRLVAAFAHSEARILAYSGNKLSWVVRNSLVVQLEQQTVDTISTSANGTLSIDVPGLQRVINSIRGQEPRNELEFLTFTYIRQKASVLMFGDLLLQTANGVMAFERNKRAAEEALVSGEVDPRVILSLVPLLSKEVVSSEAGIWVPQGLCDVVDLVRRSFSVTQITMDPNGPYGDNLLKVLKRYLLDWRKKKGLASVSDKESIFQTVDASLVHVLLILDRKTPRGPAVAGSTRAELNEVVQQGVDCFDRVAELFEEHHRLYMLSRLYQTKKNVAMVLATWRRILEGEQDTGGELIEGEQSMRKYLPRLKNADLVKEYGAWLANRNPRLGVQVFADDASLVQFQPAEAVAILKEQAPGAVKDYLEHLVFGKHHVQYVNDLIAFYLDTVLSELETSQQARETLLQSYETYRALRPPKPTYRQFIADNPIDAVWWQNRLRLLQLIGGSHGAASEYDVHALGQRLAPYSNELVPEMIILNGRERNHKEALRLLTHGLGDFDTAVRYCLLGGSSIFHSGSGLQGFPIENQPALPTKEEQGQLFETLLNEFFKIEDLSERLERTAELLERFGGWFDIEHVLDLIPESWSVELVSGFLVHAFRRLVRDKNETAVVKALSGARNLRESVAFAEKVEKMGPVVIRDGNDGAETNPEDLG